MNKETKPTATTDVATEQDKGRCALASGSAFDSRILEALAGGQWTSAGWLAGVVWKRQCGPVEKRAGQWQRMGALLHKLHRAGCVEKMTTRYNQNLWRIKPNYLLTWNTFLLSR
jgi:hypothetical protein